MARPVTVLREIEKVGRVYDILMKQKHNGFPIVDEYDPEDSLDEIPFTFGRCKGLIFKYQLIILLENKAFTLDREGTTSVGRTNLTHRDFRDFYPRYDRVLQRIDITDTERECWLHLTPYMNKAPYTVAVDGSLTKLYTLIRGLGLRHVIVVDENNKVVGIVTRKDIARFKTHIRQGRLLQRELLISDAPPLHIARTD